MNYCDDMVINEGRLNTNGTLGNSHFADASYPSVSQTKGGYMKLNIELSDIQVKAINEFLKYDDIGVWEHETSGKDEILHTEFFRALRKIDDSSKVKNNEGIMVLEHKASKKEGK